MNLSATLPLVVMSIIDLVKRNFAFNHRYKFAIIFSQLTPIIYPVCGPA